MWICCKRWYPEKEGTYTVLIFDGQGNMIPVKRVYINSDWRVENEGWESIMYFKVTIKEYNKVYRKMKEYYEDQRWYLNQMIRD
jgi:hypothetical protein